MKQKTIYIIVVVLQMIVVGFLGYKLFSNKESIQGKMVINPIKKENIIQLDPILKYYYEPKPNTNEIVNDWVPYKATYTINEDALNERFDYETAHNKDVFRIITLGDSFTYGLYVDTKDNWPERLEEKLNTNITCNNIQKFEVINLGVHGYDIQYSLNRYTTRGQKYDPNLVIWFMKQDDVSQINEIMLEKEQFYAKQMKESGEFQRLVDKGILYPSWNRAMKEVSDEYGKDQIEGIQKKFLNKFKDLYKGPLVLITFPNEPADTKQFLKESVQDTKNAAFFDGLTDIYKDPNLYFANDGHPTAQGHEIIAEDVLNYLKKNNVILCN